MINVFTITVTVQEVDEQHDFTITRIESNAPRQGQTMQFLEEALVIQAKKVLEERERMKSVGVIPLDHPDDELMVAAKAIVNFFYLS